MQRACLTRQLYMEIYGVSKAIYSTRRDEELSINGMRIQRHESHREKHTWQAIGPILALGRVSRHFIA